MYYKVRAGPSFSQVQIFIRNWEGAKFIHPLGHFRYNMSAMYEIKPIQCAWRITTSRPKKSKIRNIAKFCAQNEPPPQNNYFSIEQLILSWTINWSFANGELVINQPTLNTINPGRQKILSTHTHNATRKTEHLSRLWKNTDNPRYPAFTSTM